VTEAEIRSLLRRITYKPGYVYDLDLSRPIPALLLYQMNRPDSRGGDIPINLVCRYEIATETLARSNEAQLLEHISNQALWLEQHEMCEWLRLDGQLIHKPH
jgi:hypothetical protein